MHMFATEETPVTLNPSASAHDGEVKSFSAVAKPLGTVLTMVLLLAIDELNPVKVLVNYVHRGLTEVHVGYAAGVLLVILAIIQRERLLYHGLLIFFRCTFNNMFFRSVEIVGLENMPKEGPLILTGNHNNQFVDGVILLTNCNREISFMIAEKSFKRPFVGFLAKAFGCIPVSRPQDIGFKGAGVVRCDGTDLLRGENTQFVSQLKQGCQVEIGGKTFKIKEVVSDVEAKLDSETSASSESSKYKILPKVSQEAMYSAVHNSLRRGCCLGIFPEGGSHDQTDLLPLKAGVAIIALDAWSKHDLQVPIVPVGLNYFAGHQFGGRVVVEFGTPINIPEYIHAQYENDRNAAIEAMLKHVTTGMRSVIVPVPDYKTLQQIYMVRRLYVPEGLKLSAGETMDLNRRFAVGTFRIMQLALGSGLASSEPGAEDSETKNGLPAIEPPLEPEDISLIDNVRQELQDYMASLKKLGIRDHQVQQLSWWGHGDLVGRFFYLLVTIALGLIPHVLFNLPVMLLASYLAVGEQKKSLEASKVKLAARDVVLSYKIIYVLVFVPFLFLIYGALIWRLSKWTLTTRFLVLMSLPFFAFLGMKASEQGIRAWKDIAPLFQRTFVPSCRKLQDMLPGRRAQLQRKLHSTVKTFGPRLGDLYRQKEVDWSKEISPLVTASGLRDLLAARSLPSPSGNGADNLDMETRRRRLRAQSEDAKVKQVV